eukprot:GHUV01010204.1.p1 GENE.GHUV01010204.1~~GHUV01010204.1.p1  ORF type:complete len:121 (+),score=2.67 GHUV01010204.1:249-611(+)
MHGMVAAVALIDSNDCSFDGRECGVVWETSTHTHTHTPPSLNIRERSIESAMRRSFIHSLQLRESLLLFLCCYDMQNLELVNAVKAMAERKGCTASQLALAWVHAQGADVFTIPGTKRVK